MEAANLPLTQKAPPIAIYVDVDGTLIRNQPGTFQPVPELVARVRQWHGEGALVYCWSSQGPEYARHIAKTLGLDVCFTAFLCKPHVVVDDQSLTDWQCLVHLYPTQAATHTIATLENLLDSENPS